jgi:hypothetical protein
VSTVLAIVVMAGLLGVILYALNYAAGEIIACEVEGDIMPGAEKFPLIAAGALVAYLYIGHLLFQ